MTRRATAPMAKRQAMKEMGGIVSTAPFTTTKVAPKRKDATIRAAIARALDCVITGCASVVGGYDGFCVARRTMPAHATT